uniref:BTB domain-containing protein n=1 Tax=Panagrolaimus sp. ES5 TaxID=591445 RepID=A0AC34FX03_9BILA
MSTSKISTLGFPIAARWKISKEKILTENQKEKWIIFSETVDADGLPGVTYEIVISCNSKNEIKLRLYIELLEKLNINVSCKFLITSANKLCDDTVDEAKDDKNHVYCSRVATIEELFDPANSFFVNDYLTVTMEAIISVQKEVINANSNDQQPKCCKLGSKLWESDDKDFVIVVEGKEIELHKNVLSAESPVFKRMIQSGMQESKENKVTIIDFDFKTVESAVKYCYGFEDSNLWTIEKAANLLQFSDKYDMKELKTFVENLLPSQITVMNVCKIANASILSNSIKLRQKCFEFMLECTQKKRFITDLELLDKDFMVELMKASLSHFTME